jgi:hypothetical protein
MMGQDGKGRQKQIKTEKTIKSIENQEAQKGALKMHRS